MEILCNEHSTPRKRIRKEIGCISFPKVVIAELDLDNVVPQGLQGFWVRWKKNS